jgi:hypothetical protein
MAAPTYKWEFVADLMGDRIPKVVVLQASANLETKVGTMVINNGGQVDEAGGSVDGIIGLAMEDTAAALAAAAPIQVELLFPGALIKGTADADASALSGFAGKTVDLNADGSLDVADTTNGALSVYRTEEAGLVVYCTINGAKFATM